MKNKNQVTMQVNSNSGTGLLSVPKSLWVGLGFQKGTIFDGPYVIDGKLVYIPRGKK